MEAYSFIRERGARLFLFLARFAVLDDLVDVVSDFGPHRFVNDEFIERGYFLSTTRTQKVSFKQVRLYAFLAVVCIAARSLDGVTEKFIVYRANQRHVRRCAFTNFGRR